MAKPDRLFGLAVIAFVGSILGLGLFHYGYGWTVIGLPLAVGLLVGLLSLWLVLGGGDGESHRPPDHIVAEKAGIWPATAWVLAVLPAVAGLGFAAGPPLYVLLCLRAHRRSWRLSLILAAATLAVIVGGFRLLLRVPLPLLPPFLT